MPVEIELERRRQVLCMRKSSFGLRFRGAMVGATAAQRAAVVVRLGAAAGAGATGWTGRQPHRRGRP